jgi:uncharacterized membrane protein YgdD (TMEM256/DUF423 family)
MGMVKKLLVAGCAFAATAVVLGALGAHALEQVLTVDQLDSFETGVKYQMYHALALLIFSQINILDSSAKKTLFYLFTIGILLFSVSIYLLSMSSWLGINLRFLGPVTPVGGLLLIAGWIFALWKIISYKSVNN